MYVRKALATVCTNAYFAAILHAMSGGAAA